MLGFVSNSIVQRQLTVCHNQHLCILLDASLHFSYSAATAVVVVVDIVVVAFFFYLTLSLCSNCISTALEPIRSRIVWTLTHRTKLVEPNGSDKTRKIT